MSKVFIGGSRRLFHLNKEIKRRLDEFMENQATILIGDANGVDKAVQRYLYSCSYDKVEVFCMAGDCRNNVGDWKVIQVEGPKGKKDFSYHALKDQLMASQASHGLMIWDGKSKGTLSNVYRLIQQGKLVSVYHATRKAFLNLNDKNAWDHFLLQCSPEAKDHFSSLEAADKKKDSRSQQLELF